MKREHGQRKAFRKFRISFNSPVVLTFVLLCLGAWLLNVITLGRSNDWLFTTWHSSLKSPLTYVRFFTHVLGHTSWDHLLGNAAYLLLLGPLLEEKYGSVKIAQVILITAVVTGVVHYILFPGTALCGASGVCFAFILLTSFTGFNKGELPLTFILVAVIYLGQEIYKGIFVRDNVSNFSHIIGGVIGAFIGYIENRKKPS